MNARIKELLKQSYDEMNEPNNDPIAREWLMKDLLPEYQRFAELIVRECAGMFEGVYTDQTWPERIDKRIKQHFGVE
jgi:hypothetical protein